jgi:leucyl aminopeptidase
MTEHHGAKVIPSSPLVSREFAAIPSQLRENQVAVDVSPVVPPNIEVLGIFVGIDGDVPVEVGLNRDTLFNAGFESKVEQTIVLPQPTGPLLVAVGLGTITDVTPAELRAAAAAFARAASRHPRVAVRMPEELRLDDFTAGRVIVEGVILARYRYTELKPSSVHVPLTNFSLVPLSGAPNDDRLADGAREGEIVARATTLARDLANTPPGHLTATDMADVALHVGAEAGVEVDVFEEQQLVDMGCGGLLGVNAASAEEPRMIQMQYTPEHTRVAEGGSVRSGHLALVGKGITYDSGGISLKPADLTHLAMKMDMAGAGAILAAMSVLNELHCTTTVTAYLMCTDNMPSGSATKMGDVLTLRGGTTVEVKNTDAEGRLVMADALVLATEESPDAIVDVATLTGAAVTALGPKRAALFGTDDSLLAQVVASAEETDEPVWILPLERAYREQLDSDIADISNLGGPHAGATTAALFLAEFVDDIPWAHLDIAGTMSTDKDDGWHTKGATGFGTRLLIDLARNFVPVH